MIVDYEIQGRNERFMKRYLTELAQIEDCYTINIYLSEEDQLFRWDVADNADTVITRMSSYLPNNLKEALVIKTDQTNTFLNRLIDSGPLGNEATQQILLYILSGYNKETLSNLRKLQDERRWYIILKCSLDFCPRPEWLPIFRLITYRRFRYEQTDINIKELLMNPEFDRFKYAKSLHRFDWGCLGNVSTIYFRMDSINGIYFPMIFKILDGENQRRKLSDASSERLKMIIYDSQYTDRDEMKFWAWYVGRHQTRDLTLATYEEALKHFQSNGNQKGVHNLYLHVAENIHQRDAACWFSEWEFMKRHLMYHSKFIPNKFRGKKKQRGVEDIHSDFKDCEDKGIAKQFQYPEELFEMISKDICNI